MEFIPTDINDIFTKLKSYTMSKIMGLRDQQFLDALILACLPKPILKLELFVQFCWCKLSQTYGKKTSLVLQKQQKILGKNE